MAKPKKIELPKEPASAVSIEGGDAKAIAGDPQPGCHYCVYPADVKNPPANPVGIIEDLKQANPASAFTYFATR